MKCNGKIWLQSSGNFRNKLFGCLHLTASHLGTTTSVTLSRLLTCKVPRHGNDLHSPENLKMTQGALKRNKMSRDFVEMASAIAGFSDIFCRHVL